MDPATLDFTIIDSATNGQRTMYQQQWIPHNRPCNNDFATMESATMDPARMNSATTNFATMMSASLDAAIIVLATMDTA